MPTRHTVELSLTDLFDLVQRENLGQPHAVLAGGEHCRVPRLAGHGTRLDDYVRDAVVLAHRARVEYYGWVHSGADSYAVLVAATGRAAVVLTRTGDRVTVDIVESDRLVESMIHRLPDVPAGHGAAISIRAADLAGAGGEVLRAPVLGRPQEARRLDALLRAPRSGGARLYTARRDQGGTRHRAKECVTVLDIAQHGRWIAYATTGRGERAVNAVPATAQLLAATLTGLWRS